MEIEPVMVPPVKFSFPANSPSTYDLLVASQLLDGRSKPETMLQPEITLEFMTTGAEMFISVPATVTFAPALSTSSLEAPIPTDPASP